MVRQKIFRKLCYYSLVGTIVTIILLAIGYYTPRKWSSASKTGCNWQICVENNGAHTNIIVPVDNDIFHWSDRLDIDKIDGSSNSEYKYLSFGWGERDFYLNTPTWDDLDLGLAFKALFLPTAGVMEVKKVDDIPNSETIKCIAIDKNDYLTSSPP
jgi:uncharacterized protein (TIGR02117 family)